MRWKGSVSVTAMVALSVILIIALALVNFTFFMAQNSRWDYEKNRAGWFLEGRVQEYLDGLMNGSTQVAAGRQEFQEKIEGRDQPYFFDIAKQDDGSYVLKAGMFWKNRFPAGRTVEFRAMNPYGYALYFNGSAVWSASKKSAVMGGIGVRGDFSVRTVPSEELYLYYSRSHPCFLEYGNSAVITGSKYFTNDLGEASFLFSGTLSLSGPLGSPDSRALRKNADLKNAELPDYKKIRDACLPYRDPAWVIRSYQFFDSKYIVNPKSRIKELVSYGNGYAGSFPLAGRNTYHAYIIEGRTGGRYAVMDPTQTAYSFGTPDMKMTAVRDGRLELNASISPVAAGLPDGAFNELGTVALSGPGWSVCSSDEKIESVYFYDVSPSGRLSSGNDFSYDRKEKKLHFQSGAFNRDELFPIGRGDGRTAEFKITGKSLNPAERYFFYAGRKRIANYAVNGNRILFSPAPANGSEIVGFRVPKMFIKKEPPGPNAGVYVDINDRAAVLDFDRVQNYPKNGVIHSELPLMLRGNARFPVAVICSANVYLDNVNAGGKGEPVFVASGTGVFVYQENDSAVSVQSRCVIYTPLNALEAVQDNSETAGPYRVTGSVVFGYEGNVDPSGSDWGGREFVYDASVEPYFERSPFLFIPRPFTILKAVRN